MPKELQEIGKEKIINGNNMSDGLDYYGNNLFQEIGDGLMIVVYLGLQMIRDEFLYHKNQHQLTHKMN